MVLHSEQMNAILATFNDEQLGIIIRAFFEWCFTGKEYDGKDGMIKFAFLTLKTQAKHDFAKYDVIVERRREAGKKGGFKKAENRKQNLANVANANNFSKCKQNVANLANLANNDNVNDNDTTINSNECNSSSVCIDRTHTLSNPTLEQVLEYAENMMIDVEMAKKFFYHYDAVEWIDGNGSKIKNWQSKLQSWQMNDSIKEQDKQKKQDKNDRSMWQERLLREHEEELRKQQVI